MYAKDVCQIGDAYGKLIVSERDYQTEDDLVGQGKQRRAYYKCACECGNACIVLGYNLKRLITTSCGCAKRVRKPKNVRSLSGELFGNLRVVERDFSVKSMAGSHVKWLCECTLCGKVVSVRGSELRAGNYSGCNCVQQPTASRIVDLTQQVFGHLHVVKIDTSVQLKSGTHAKWICMCDICGGRESVSSSYLRSGVKDRCHNCCAKSIGESKIADILSSNNIKYMRDTACLGCINDKTGRRLRFDFVIVDDMRHEVIYAIEYDGLQHFQPAPMWDDTMSFEERKRLDSVKTKWCIDNDIPLIRIPYTKLRTLCLDDLLLDSSVYKVA